MNKSIHKKNSVQKIIKENTYLELKLFLKKNSYDKILFITDKKIYPKLQKFLNLKINYQKIILSQPKAEIKTIQQIIKKKFDLIIGAGSGTINDICKYSSFLQKKPYVIFPTAPSMNGYSSENASILVNGSKKSLSAHLPKAIFIDKRILSNSPKILIKAGVGDSLCVLTCNFDWLLSNLILGTKYDASLFKRIKFQFDRLVNSNYESKNFIKILMDNLLTSGFAMTSNGSSQPASQGEHLISHYIEMKYPKIAKEKYHGEHIAITTMITLKIQENLLKKEILQLKSKKINFDKIYQIFRDRKIAKYCLAQIESKNLTEIEIENINQNLKKNWRKIKKKLEMNFISSAKMQKIYDKFEIEVSSNNNSLFYEEATKNAFLIRDRLTCLDL